MRYAARVMIKSPGLTSVALLSLMLGIGFNTAVFSAVHAVLLSPLPYSEPDRIVQILGTLPRQGRDDAPISYPDFVDWRERSQSFEALAAFNAEKFRSFVLTGVSEPRRVSGATVSASLFPLLGARAEAGRTFLPEEDKPGTAPVALISHGLWRREFNSDPGLVGKGITLDGVSHTVVGVMPQDFQFPIQSERIEVWATTNADAAYLTRRGVQYLAVIGRLKPGVAREQAQAEMDNIARQLEQQYPNSNSGRGVRVASLHEQLVGSVHQSLVILLCAVALVLLIACANVANLLLARAAARQQEFALRVALGAGRRSLIQQLVVEGLLLGLTGALLGVLLAAGLLRVITSAGLENVPRLEEAGLNGYVLAFTALIALAASLGFGLAPVFQALRADPNEALKEQGRSATGGVRRARARHALVVVEVAVALVLLIEAGLIVKSFVRLRGVSPGLEARGVLTAPLVLPDAKYPEAAQKAAFYQRVIQRVETLPGLQSVGAITPLPFSRDAIATTFEVEGRAPTHAGEKLIADYRSISPNYFQTVGIPLKVGRPFNEQDRADAPGVVIVSESTARAYWPGVDPVGKRLRLRSPRQPWLTVVGVVGNVKHNGLDADPKPELYLSYLQEPWSFMTIVIRTDAAHDGIAAALAREIKAVDPDQPVPEVRAMSSLVSGSVARQRAVANLFAAFSTVALILAVIGVYGVVSYSVAQRTHELGIRMALGARPRQIFSLVMRQVLALTLVGVAAGVFASFALTRVTAGLLFDVSPTDPAMFLAPPLLLLAVTAAACYRPVSRATRIDPMNVLRHE